MHTESSKLKATSALFQPQVPLELNINDASEVRRWTQHWNVSEAELRMAVAEVGTDIDEIRTALGK